MPTKKRPTHRPAESPLPQFVVGIAEGSPGERCCRCQRALDPAAEAARAFEHTQPLCDLCSLEHAPPFINRCLIAEAQRQRSHHPDYLERLASHEQIQRALRQQLSPSEAESLVWALLQLYPQTVEVLAERVGTEKLAQILEAGERWAEGETEASVLATLDAVVRRSPVESLRAHELWQRLETLPLEPACAELRAVLPRFQTPALYHRVAKVMIKKASVYAHMCEPAQAAQTLKHGVALIDDEAEPELLLGAYHNLAFYLCECRRFTEADRLLLLVSTAFKNRLQLVISALAAIGETRASNHW